MHVDGRLRRGRAQVMAAGNVFPGQGIQQCAFAATGRAKQQDFISTRYQVELLAWTEWNASQRLKEILSGGRSAGLLPQVKGEHASTYEQHHCKYVARSE